MLGLGLGLGLSLEARRQNVRSLMSNGILTPLVTRTRASDMTYTDADGLLKVAGTDEFPIDYSGGFPAQSLWEGSTNLVTRGDEIEIWTSSNTTRVLNGSERIADYKNATLVTATGSGVINHFLTSTNNENFTSGTTYTFSIFAKAGTTNRFQITATSSAFGTAQYANFGLTGAGSVLASAGGTARIAPYPNGWYRCSFTLAATSTATFNAHAIGFIDSDTAIRFPAFEQAGESIYVFGAQTEAKPYPTPYIPTSGVTASRASPSVSITGSAFASFYNQSEGTFVVDYLQPYNMTAGTRLFDLRNEVGTERHVVEQFSDGNTQYQIRTNGGSSVVNINSGITQIGERKKTAIGYKSGDYGLITTGGSVQSSLLSTLPIIERLNVSQAVGGFGQNNLYINSLIYYPRRLTNTELEAITNA